MSSVSSQFTREERAALDGIIDLNSTQTVNSIRERIPDLNGKPDTVIERYISERRELLAWHAEHMRLHEEMDRLREELAAEMRTLAELERRRGGG